MRRDPDAPSEAAVTEAPEKAKRTGIFRWRGIIPLLLIIAAVAIGWQLFSGRILRNAAIEASTKALGTQVDIESVDIDLQRPRVTIRNYEIADPFNPRRNLLDARAIVADLDGRALLERKIVIRRLTIASARAGAPRSIAAKPVAASGFAPRALREMREFAAQFKVPLLSLTPVDTIRAIVLDPTQLATVQSAIALKQRADSVREAIEAGWRSLRIIETLDSSRALAQRLAATNPRELGILGTRRAIEDVRRTIRQVDSAKKRVEALERSVVAGTNSLVLGVRTLDSARLSDYAFARGLLKLPTFDAPEIGAALFGKVSIDQFQKALYWSEIASQYVPPGLRPRTTVGPDRVRRSGSTVHFPKARSYPRFLMQQGDLALTIGAGAAASRYVARVTGVTSEPALIGEPLRVRIRPVGTGGPGLRISADATIDHRSGRVRDDARVVAQNVAFQRFALPGIPLSLDPGRAGMELSFLREGNRMVARWHVESDSVLWVPDTSARGPQARVRTIMEQLVVRVLSGIEQLELTADVEGEISRPRLRVRSNLDRAIADRLRAVVGEEVKRAETRVRAEVDKIVERETAPIRARVAAAREEALQRVAEAKTRIETEKAALEERLRGLAAGVIGS